MNERTFAELYCEQRGISPENYAHEVLRETLYPHARFLAGLVRLLRSRHFAADIEFVADVGQIRRYRDYATESEGYAHHPENRGFLRAVLNVRISSRRMRRLVRTTLHATVSPRERERNEEQHSAVPFEKEESGLRTLRPDGAGKV